jgi:hypothetical protein
MSEIHAGVGGCHANRGSGNDIARSAADWLYLAAAPTFAMMALLTAVRSGPADLLCSAGSSPLSGMTPMYLLMSAFHLAPWLQLFAGLRRKAGRS